MRIVPYGDRGILVEVHDLAAALAVYRHLQTAPPADVVDIVPAFRTVLLRYARGVPPARLAEAAAGLAVILREPTLDARSSRTRADQALEPDIVLRVRYDGGDLESVARHHGMTVDDVVARHVAARWMVAFCGFAPGFGYLTSPDWDLDVPRHRTPRTHVPSGSVAIAGQFSAVYPRSSPGGWQLIGHTAATLWDLDRSPPSALTPGVRVRFEAVQ